MVFHKEAFFRVHRVLEKSLKVLEFLGPLLFIIFINDLPNICDKFSIIFLQAVAAHWATIAIACHVTLLQG